MAKGEMKTMVGRWAFLVGLILALIFGFIPAGSWLPGVLVVIGLIVGYLNIQEKEIGHFLTAGTVLVLMGFLGAQALQTLADLPYIGSVLIQMLNNIVVLFVPATIVVAVKSVLALAKD